MLKKIISKLQLIFIPCGANNYRPEFLQSNFLPYLLIFLFILKFAIVPFLIYLPNTNLFADVSKAVLIELTNKQRKELGLNSLKENPQLNQAALLKAKDILEKDYFAHWSPQGVSPWHWIKKANYNYQTAGENLGIGFLDSSEVHQAWIDSPSHKANLLNPKYQEIGIAVLTGDFQGNETTVVVQIFGSQKKEKRIKNYELKLSNKQKIKKTEEKIEEKIEEKQEKLAESRTLPTEIRKEELVKFETQSTENEIGNRSEKKGIVFGIAKFISYNYFSLVQDIAFYLLSLILFGLLLNIFIHIKIQHRDLIFKTIFCIFLLIIFVFLDKNLIIQIIPHKLEIM